MCQWDWEKILTTKIQAIQQALGGMREERPSILCLGVSYPCVPSNLARRSGNLLAPSVVDDHSSSSSINSNVAQLSKLDSIIQLVVDKVLNQMDGRDLVRCQATEDLCRVDVYCVSQEQGALYRPDRHMDANFNGRNFVKHLKIRFKGCQFDQILLDYFWIPPAWNQSHWKRSFFEKTLVDLVVNSIIRIAHFPPEYSDGQYQRGVVYFPFCFNILKKILATFLIRIKEIIIL